MNASTARRPKPVALIILDGFGVAPPGPGNAITLAKTKTLNNNWISSPHCYLRASGSAVGLPQGTNGNSEVGHINIGAGRVVYQELPRINTSIANQTFFSNSVLIQAAENVKQNGSNLHIMGLVSEGNVHSSMDHLSALLKLFKQQGLGSNVYLHAFTDGRDTPPDSATKYLGQATEEMRRMKVGKLASVIGRYYAMDRDERWERTNAAYELLTKAAGTPVSDYIEAVEKSRSEKITDEFYPAYYIVGAEAKPLARISAGDSVIFFNYRGDRARQLTDVFTSDNIAEIDLSSRPSNLFFVTMTDYEKDSTLPAAFPSEEIKMPLGRVIAERGYRQLRIAESEKYPHVTYFFNGGREDQFDGEDRIEVPSPKVATYDMKPEMSASEVTEKLISKIQEKTYDFILVNYANGDMVGHTGVIPAGVRSVEIVDECVGKVLKALLGVGGAAFVTADHGNVEEMINLQTGEVDTEHSTNPVPFTYVTNNNDPRELQYGILADIAPTVLGVMGIEPPGEMTGRNLLNSGR